DSAGTDTLDSRAACGAAGAWVDLRRGSATRGPDDGSNDGVRIGMGSSELTVSLCRPFSSLRSRASDQWLTRGRYWLAVVTTVVPMRPTLARVLFHRLGWVIQLRPATYARIATLKTDSRRVR